MEKQEGYGPYCTVSFDCDFPRDVEVLPEVSRLFRERQYVASFACIGRWVRQFPEEHRCLVADGHELLNHTETHPNLFHPGYSYASDPDLSTKHFNQISERERRREIELCDATFKEILGYNAKGFRTPHFGHQHVNDVYGVLNDLDYSFSSSVMVADPAHCALPYRTEPGVWEFPVSPCPDHPHGLLDSWHAIGKTNPSHNRPGELAGLFRISAERIQRCGGHLNIYLDPKASLESGELHGILDCLRATRLPVVTYDQLCV